MPKFAFSASFCTIFFLNSLQFHHHFVPIRCQSPIFGNHRDGFFIRLVKCKQYARKMPCLNAKAPCSQCPKLSFVNNNSILPCYCPMIKPGNGIHGRLDGSILVGKYNSLNCLIHPRDAFNPLYERIRKSVSRGNQVTLTVKDS